MTTPTSLTEIPDKWQSIRVLTANVGNINFACRGLYNHKLCQKKVEENISNNIQALKPDIIFLQELLHPSQCDGWTDLDKSRVEFDKKNQPVQNQARRLLGNSYTIYCVSRMRPEVGHPVGMECIGVRIGAGIIEGYQPGGLFFSSHGLDSPSSKCNPEFVIMSATAKVRNVTIKLVNAHPHSRDQRCRDDSLRQLFENITKTPDNKTYTIIAGDFNFDPFRSPEKIPNIWKKNVGVYGSGKPFYYHSGIAEHVPPYPTASLLVHQKTIDHILSNFAIGICSTLGESPMTHRIDGGKGMDHRAILCDMWIPPQ